MYKGILNIPMNNNELNIKHEERSLKVSIANDLNQREKEDLF